MDGNVSKPVPPILNDIKSRIDFEERRLNVRTQYLSLFL